jgi:phosphoribosyl-ATP pyrophosphohydrolase/phosphoribosyl-AMP cyclohydrolase
LLTRLYALIEERERTRPEGSYTTYLFDQGLDKILKKVGEEAAETIIAAKNEGSRLLVGEVSDLVYHLLVLLVARGRESRRSRRRVGPTTRKGWTRE